MVERLFRFCLFSPDIRKKTQDSNKFPIPAVILTHKHSIKLIKQLEIDDLLPEKPLSTLFFHGIFWKSKTSNTVDFPKAFPENLAWGNPWLIK